jgi:hypothetical protein
VQTPGILIWSLGFVRSRVNELFLIPYKKALHFLLVGSALGWLVLTGTNALAQDTPPAPGPEVENLSPEEVARISRKKETENALQKIRELYARGEYQSVINAVDASKSVDPTNLTFALYRKWAQQKLLAEESPVEATPVYGSSLPGIHVTPHPSNNVSSNGAGLPGLGEASLPPGGQSHNNAAPAVSSSTPAANSEASAAQGAGSPQPQDQAVASAARKDKGSSRGFLLIAAILGLLVAIIAAASKFFMRSRSYVPAAESDDEDEEVVFEPKGLMMPNPLTGEQNLSPQDIAANIEKSVGSGSGSEPPPTFDIFIPDQGDQDKAPSGEFDNLPTVIESTSDEVHLEPGADHPEARTDSTKNASGADQLVGLDFAPIELSSPEKSEPAEKPAKAEQEKPKPGTSTDTVSFEDLGIFIEGASPDKTEKSTAAEPASSGSSAAPAATQKDLPKAPAPQAQQKPGAEEPIRLDSFDFELSEPGSAPLERPKPAAAENVKPAVAAKPESVEKPAPEAKPVAVTKQEGFIALDDLLQQTLQSKAASPKANASPAQAAEQSGTPEVDTVFIKPPTEKSDNGAGEKEPEDRTYGFSADTLHSQDTVRMMPAIDAADASPDDALAETKVLPSISSLNVPANAPVAAMAGAAAASSASESKQDGGPDTFYTATPPHGTAALDERSERMFREQYDRGIKAFEQKNWKQAVHYFSISAAIQPDNEDVRTRLRDARDLKRQEESR